MGETAAAPGIPLAFVLMTLEFGLGAIVSLSGSSLQEASERQAVVGRAVRCEPGQRRLDNLPNDVCREGKTSSRGYRVSRREYGRSSRVVLPIIGRGVNPLDAHWMLIGKGDVWGGAAVVSRAFACLASRSGSRTTLSCSFGSVRAMMATQSVTSSGLYGMCGMPAGM